MSVILGIDPGLAALGWAVIQDGARPRLVASGAIRTAPGEVLDDRLLLLALYIQELLREHKPIAAGMEDYVWHGSARDARTAEVLGMASVVCTTAKVPVFRCQPQQWRRHLGISRSATKADVRDILRVRLGWTCPNQHAADAAAIALWAGSHALEVVSGE